MPQSPNLTITKRSLLDFNLKLSYGLIVAEIAALPVLFFLIPSQSEHFQAYVVALISFCITGLIGMNIVLSSRVRFQNSPLIIPFLLILASTGFSIILSGQWYTGFFGANDRYINSALMYLSMIIHFYFITTFLPSRFANYLVTVLSISSTLSCLIYLAIFLGLPKITPLSDPTTLALMAALSIPGSCYLIFLRSPLQRNLGILGLTSSLITVAVIAFFPSIVISLLLLAITLIISLKNRFARFLLLGSIAAFIIANLALNNLKPINPQVTKNAPPILPLQISVDIVRRSVTDSPLHFLFGHGSGTFYESFSEYRPAILNQTDLKPLRFTKTGWEFLDVLHDNGLLGLIIHLAFALAAIRVAYMYLKQATPDQPSALAVIPIGALLAIVTAPAATTVIFFFVIGLSCLVTNTKAGASQGFEKTAINLSTFYPSISYLGLFLLLIGSSWISYLIINDLRAALLTYQAVQAAEGHNSNRSFALSAQAVTLVPYRDIYHINASKAGYSYAQEIALTKQPLEINQEQMQSLLTNAIHEASLAAGYNTYGVGTNPRNVTNWETLAALYLNLSSSVVGAPDHAVAALNKATKLDPTNPQLKLTYARLLSSQQHFSDALRLLDESYALDPSDVTPMIEKTDLLVSLKRSDEAKQNLNAVTKQLDESSPQGQALIKKRESLK